MIENQTNARWIAIVGGVVILSTCAACLLFTVLITSAYGGQTIRLRNPFSPQVVVVTEVVNNSGTGGGSTTSGGNTSSGGNGTGGSTSSGGTSGGGSTVGVPSNTNAASYLPRLSGYTQPDVSNISGALDFVVGAQSADSNTFQAQSISGIVTTVLVARLDEFVGCYQQTGAVDGQIYVRSDLATLLSGNVPPMGAVVVANQSRLRESLISCAVAPNDPNSFSAQSANQPCGNFGTFTANGESFTYVYAGTAAEFCTAVETHFGGFAP